MTNTGLTRKEKEKLVVELYRQEMTYAQIAKEAHMFLRDIGPILIGQANINLYLIRHKLTWRYFDSAVVGGASLVRAAESGYARRPEYP